MNCLSQRKKFKNKHPVWSDPSDGPLKEAQKEKVSKDEENEKAISTDDDDDDDEDDCDMFATDVRSKAKSLETKELVYKHVTNINDQRSYKGSVKRVQFHPKSKIALVALGYAQTDLYEVNGDRNRYLQNIKMPPTKQPYCSFDPNGDKIVMSANSYRGNFFTYDMISGSIKKYNLKVGHDNIAFSDFQIAGDYMACRREGSREVLILSSKTYEIITSLKINEPVKAIRFTSNNKIYIAGENANVYIWDMRKASCCKHKFQDEGTVHITSLAISETSNQLSIGSDSGIVNTYELGKVNLSKQPEPIKTHSNLKSSVDIIQYNSTGELLLMGASKDPGAFRMIHSHSGTVYKNFPVPDKKYGHLLSVDFSPLSGYLALGSNTGRAHLCRLSHYKSY